MLMMIIAFVLGGAFWICFHALISIEKYDIERPIIHLEDEPEIETCQIYHSYLCKSNKDCKGNPALCEWSIRKP